MRNKYFVTIDDEPSIRKIMGMVAEGYCDKVCEASDGEEGYSLIEKLSRENSRILLFTDHGMPNLKGLDMIKRIKEKGLIEKMGEDLNIYMLFSPNPLEDYGEEIGKEAVEVGAKGYFLKPISIKPVRDIVKNYFD